MKAKENLDRNRPLKTSVDCLSYVYVSPCSIGFSVTGKTVS